MGLFHASFDATTAQFGRAFIPGHFTGATTYIGSLLVAVAAVLIVIFTRGRLSYAPHGSKNSS